MPPGKKKIFLISDYRNVTYEPTRDQSYWILKELDMANRFKAYSTANRVMNSSCFKNIDFLTPSYIGKIVIGLLVNGEPAFITTEVGSVSFGVIKMTDLTKVVRSVRNFIISIKNKKF